MKKTASLWAAAILAGLAAQGWAQQAERRISVEDYRDKMAAGWLGQMAGVGWGAPTEFRYKGATIPEEEVPKWKPEMINQFRQDDIYVEMTFLRSMELHGFDVSIRQAGIDFANSGYRLWHANKFGRENLRDGIAPPDSGHPQFSAHADDIDYQIEADYSGLIAPGMPNVGIALGEKFGRLMNYGDGLYGGQFVAGMYAEAFFETDPKKIVEAGLACIPAQSQYAEAVRDVLRWHEEEPKGWQSTWRRIEDKYQDNKAYRRFSCNKHEENMDFNIDAKINGAYIVMGLLYGERDLDRTIVISMRCGQDSDCNPSNAGGILFTTLGMKKLPVRFTSALDGSIEFSHTAYDFDALLEVCEKLTRQAAVRSGGRIEKNAAGQETLVIPQAAPKPSAYETCWAPGPIANSRFTEAEMKQINPPPDPPRRARGAAPPIDISQAVAAFAPGWTIRDCGSAMEPGLRDEWGGRKNVLATHPLNRKTPCILSRSVKIAPGKKTSLELTVRSDDRGGWDLAVQIDKQEVFRKTVDTKKWLDLSVDLSEYAGKTINIEVWNQANGWHWEGAFWSKIAIETNVENAWRPLPGELGGGATVLSKRDVLLDKIRGGWVGKSYGVSFGGPTEFKYEGKIIEGPLKLDPRGLNKLKGQDDMYVNMALLKALVDHGLEATSADFAKEFAYGGFLLWHANGQGRQNILEGIPPEKSGHPLYNPHADDIDFQIECDFIGLVCPGLPQVALDICDRAGHLMNYGDGVYGGYFVTAMYAAAFLYNDVQRIVEAGFQALPEGSGYAEIIGDLLKWHKQYPLDWKKTWQELEDKYNNDLCPWGVHSKFNIQARLNGAYIALGLLYGEGDLAKTVELSTRCGQDSDCNPANAGGVIGTMLGLKNLPEKITTALAPHMNTDFNFTPFSIESASKECLRLALENITANGGKESAKDIHIKVQPFKTSRKAEISFPTLAPLELFYVTDEQLKWTGDWELFPHRKNTMSLRRSSQTGDFLEVEFAGNAVYVQGDIRFDQGILEYIIDGKSMGTRDMYLPKKWRRADQSTAVWVTGLPDGNHTLKVVVTGKKNGKSEGIMVSLGKVVTYSGEIAK